MPTYESQLKEAQALVAKDDAAVKTAEKKVKDIKKNLLSVNDKLAEAKGKGSAKLVDVLGKDSGKFVVVVAVVVLLITIESLRA